MILFLAALLLLSPAASSQCGFQTRELNGTITSLKEDSGNWQMSCVWNITAPEESAIHLQITNFSIYGSPGSCQHAWLIIRGNTTDENKDKVNKKLCGSRIFSESIRLENNVNIEYYTSGRSTSYFTLIYHRVLTKPADLSAAWIAKNTEVLLSAKDRLPFAIPALYLFDEDLLKKETEIGYKFRTQYLLHLSEDLLRNSTRRLSLADLSHHVTALLSICSNPRSFRGINLVDHLWQMADTHPTFLKPFDILTLCNAREKMTSNDTKRLLTILKKEDPSTFLLDFKAVAVMALICVKHQIEEFSAIDEEYAAELQKLPIDETLEQSVNSLKLHQKRDGGYGSLQTTILVYQALLAAGAHGWDASSAFKFISVRNHTDGSFGNLNDFYAVLPTLKDRTLLHINASNCDFSENGTTPLQEVKDKLTAYISVAYELWIGDEADVKHTITLKFPNGTSFVDVMRLAAEKDDKFQLKWTFVKEVIYVYELCNIINNPTSGKYWRLYTLTDDQQTLLYKQGLENYVPGDGDTAIMWYRTVDLSV